ncbi:HD domain-containing protein [Clostridium subterminale]|uniref:HD domain-containing protein n=1 Tax=Clostridium subterminale TaxID=1550 RepID=A0ABP3VXS4_CLOSU
MEELKYKVPSRKMAEKILDEASILNPGPWVEHSRYVAEAAALIAKYDKDLDEDTAYVLGLLHDIGRRNGRHCVRHAIDGYNYALEKGYDLVARISITHSFLCNNIDDICGEMDLTKSEYKFMKNYLSNIEYNSYDKLIQLCDALALPSGFCLVEKRMVDVVMRYGFTDFTLKKWKKTFEIKEYFEGKIGKSIYNILQGIEKNTFN